MTLFLSLVILVMLGGFWAYSEIEEVKHGTTRIVILTSKHAYKLPTYVEWRLFLTGLLCNLQEKQFSGMHKNLCPVIYHVPGGILNVMPRAFEVDWYYMEKIGFDYEEFVNHDNLVLPVENKIDSFGILDGRLVAVDYGS